MGHRISHFRSYFQKKKTMYVFRRWSFLLTLKEFLKNTNPLQSYGQNSNLSPSKPPYVHLGGGANSSIITVISWTTYDIVIHERCLHLFSMHSVQLDVVYTFKPKKAYLHVHVDIPSKITSRTHGHMIVCNLIIIKKHILMHASFSAALFGKD